MNPSGGVAYSQTSSSPRALSHWDDILGTALPPAWDQGTFVAMGQSSHLDTPLLELQNTKKLYGTKSNCAHVQLGQILDQKIQKRQKEPTAISEELGPKPKVWQKPSAPLPHTQYHKRIGKTPKLPLQPNPWSTTTLTAYKEWACPPHLGRQQESLFYHLHPVQEPQCNLAWISFGFSRQFPSTWGRPRTLVGIKVS